MNHQTNVSSASLYAAHHQDGRVVKALDLRSNGRIVRVGSNPAPGKIFIALSLFI